MDLICLKVEARFPGQGVSLSSDSPLPLQCDSHHEDTFILKVKGLTVSTRSGGEAGGCQVEMHLTLGEDPGPRLAGFAAAQEVPLTPTSPLPPELTLPLTLAACHLPGERRFIFSENAVLTAARTPAGDFRLTVTGDFKSRTIPCQETDLILHLARPEAAKLLSYWLSAVQELR
uniref:Uncharacterized protein n=1 Tax=Desulfobacca acetoxidans TaxID=60893 RepID=A0A7V4LCT9_9BACT